MNKKIKLAIPFAVLTLTCGVAAVGCSGGHEHRYTKLQNDGETHVMVCPDDNTPDENTRTKHEFVAGECECGATEQQTEVTYGSVSGSVRLYKLGEYVSAEGVKVEIDADADVEGSVEDGKYVYTIDNVPVGESYELTISKSGYETKKYAILLEEEGEEATIGGANGVTLNYEVFGLFAGWDSASHDMSHVNDTNPYITFREHTGAQTLNVITKDSYNGVSAGLDIKYGNSDNNTRTQGIILKFSDGKHMVVRYHNGDLKNDKGGYGNIQFAAGSWDYFPIENSLFGEDVTGAQWGELPIYQLSEADTAGIKSADGLRLNTVVKDGKMTVLLGGKYIGEYTLPNGYADKNVQVAYFAFDAANNAKFTYEITETLPALESVLDINVTKPEGVDCTVTATPQKDKYAFGEELELTFNEPQGYMLDSLIIDGEDRYNDVTSGKLVIVANRASINVAATFVKEEPISINLSVKGKKLGTTAALANGTKVMLGETEFKVTNGKITGEVIKGRYTVSVDGYKSQEISVNEELTEIVFEYDAFEIVRWDHGGHGLAHVNDNEPYIEWEGPGASLNAVTKECLFTNASVSVIIKGGFTTNGDKQQGIILRFEDGKAAILNINIDDEPRLQFRPELFSDENDASIGLRTVFEKGSMNYKDVWVEFRNVTQAEVQKYNSETGIELKVLRYGKSLFVYLDGEFKGRADMPDKYENSKMGFGVFSYDAVVGSKWKYEISETVSVPTVEITDETPTDANGTVSVPQNTVVGDIVTITVTPSQGYILKTLTVSGGITPVLQADGTYTFTAEKLSYTVTAEFEVAPNPVEASVSGTTLGNVTAPLADGTTVKFTNKDTGTATALTVTNGKIEGVLLNGNYVVSAVGYYDLETTVTDGEFEGVTSFAFQKIMFTTNGINEPTKNIFGEGNPVSWAADDTKAASEGKIKSVKDGKIYEWSVDEYDDVAFTVTLKSGNGNQGLIMRFGGQQMDVRLRFENNKAQWIGGENGGWWWGSSCIHDRWDFGSGSDYANPMSNALLEKYNGTGLNLTLARKGGMVYALIDGKIYAAQSVSDFSTSKVRLCVFVEGATSGYEIPFVIEDADAVLTRAGVAVGEDLTAYGGAWTEDSAAQTLKVSGNRGYAEFKAEANTLKESVTIKIKGDVGGDQGVMYRFADGKYIAVRYQNNGGNYKVQYTMDTVFFSDGSLKGWTDFFMTDEEKQAFDESGLDLTFIRDGATVYTLLGDRLLDTVQLDGKYAEMSGVMGIMIWDGADVAFTYEHKTGTNVTVPAQN